MWTSCKSGTPQIQRFLLVQLSGFRFHVKRLGNRKLRWNPVWNPTCESSIEMWIETRQSSYKPAWKCSILLLLKHLCHVSIQLGNWESGDVRIGDVMEEASKARHMAQGEGGGAFATPMFLFQRLSHGKLRYPLKNDGWKRYIFFFELAPFQGTCYIDSFSGGLVLFNPHLLGNDPIWLTIFRWVVQPPPGIVVICVEATRGVCTIYYL